jgi:hypothetical protein
MTDSAVDPATASVYTFADQNIGAPRADRLVVVCFAFRAGTAITISAVTIDGIAATAAAEARNTASGLSDAAIYYAIVPDGTAADVQIVLSGSAARCGVATYVIEGNDGILPYGSGTGTRAATPGDMTATLSNFRDFGPAIGVAYSAAGVPQLIYAAHTTTQSEQSGQAFDITTADGNTTSLELTEDLDTNTEDAAAAPQSFALAAWRYLLDNPIPFSPEILATGRVHQPGFGAVANSNGTDTGQNSRISMYNEVGTAFTEGRVHYGNFRTNGTTEAIDTDDITVRCAIEYPAGVFTAVNFGGVRDVVLSPGEFASSDPVTVTIPADHQFWVRTYVTVASGDVWPRGYVINGSRGEAADTGTGTVDQTTSGTIVGSANAFGPLGVTATAFQGNPVNRALATIGDSICAGSGDGNFDARGNTGWNGRASYNKIPHVVIAVGGTSAQGQAAAFTNRLEMLHRLGITDVIIEWGINDLAGGRTAAQVEADLQSLWNLLDAEGFNVYQTTITPRSTSTDNWVTLTNQTALFTTHRPNLNTAIRAIPAPLTGIVDMAAATEATGGDIGKWLINTAWGIDSYTSDGLHPNVTNVNGEGGHFPMRDAALALIDTWV